MIREKEQSAFIRNFIVSNGEKFDFFLGSGTSIQAGIPTGSELVWHFKREIYCSETDTSKDYFKDLQSTRARNIIQEYFDSQGSYPKLYDPSEYSFYFEKCYDSEFSRKQFIQSLVQDIPPITGHLCLAHLFMNKIINNIWTTNFDGIVEAGINSLDPAYSFNVVSSTNKASLNNIENNPYSSIYKLHGDYRYDDIQNTSDELKELESSISNQFEKKLFNSGLIVIGYAGNDDSIMNVFETNIENAEFLAKGLFWIKPQNSELSQRVKALMEKACKINTASCVINIESFDDFMHSIYRNIDNKNEKIDKRWINYPARKININFSPTKIEKDFIKMNTFVSKEIPLCNAFDTDVKSWPEFREIIGENKIIAGLYNGKIYCFDEETNIQKIFEGHINSKITKEKFPEKDLYKDQYQSVYAGMLYQLIRKSLVITNDFIEFDKNKYYFPSTKTITGQYIKYDAIELALSFCKGKYYLSILPTVYIASMNGQEIEKFTKQFEINSIMSKIRNSEYDKKLKIINEKIKKDKSINFEYKSFCLKFEYIYVSCGGHERQKSWPELQSYNFTEPEMSFSARKSLSVGVNQLKGILKHGPIDYSYCKEGTVRPPIRLAIISPNQGIKKLLTHLNSMNQKHRSSATKEDFLPLYEGFNEVYRRTLVIPPEGDMTKCRLYDENEAKKLSIFNFIELLKRQIDFFSNQTSNFDVLIIYIPTSFVKFRENKEYDEDFNLHDAIKLYATDKGIKLQFIEEKSFSTYNHCKVLWALSASIYAKASGVLWHPVILNKDTAFVGISYAKSNKKGICIGCSQLFDSTGTGMRLILRKIDDPQYLGKNPYMKRDEARNTMSQLREEYYKCEPTSKLNRIVIHKTTPFTKEEIIGFTQALEGIDDIELLQIQEYSSWRAIRFKQKIADGAHPYALKRGAVVQLNDDKFLLWTHGCVMNDELAGKNSNYYKGGRGIPAPLLIKRFYGKASGDSIAKEILMLTKMNWNSSDNLYKILPVTLDFAKTLSRMSKQNEAIYNRSYDFRFFM